MTLLTESRATSCLVMSMVLLSIVPLWIWIGSLHADNAKQRKQIETLGHKIERLQTFDTELVQRGILVDFPEAPVPRIKHLDFLLSPSRIPARDQNPGIWY